MSSVPNILSIAGSDPSGGAGIQADLKSIAACGGYGMAALTALTVQNTRGVTGVHVPPAGFLAEQLESVSADVRIDAIKIGMLANADVVRTVAAWLEGARKTPGRGPAVVLDPVLVATSGDRLLADDAEAALRALLPLADVLTPNLAELALLARAPQAADWAAALEQARTVAAEYGVLVLAKGGHLGGDQCPDALVDAAGPVLELPGERIETRNTHGTGCSLSSALATLYARTGDWADALRLAKDWLAGALRASGGLDVGSGHGPVNHFAALWAGRPAPRADALLERWWEEIAPLRASIDSLGFVRALSDGTLPRADFEHYLAQDSLYLRTYARVLSRAAELAPTLEEQAFWAASAHGCLDTELTLHRSRLDGTAGSGTPVAGGWDPVSGVEPSRETTAYLNHLLAASAGGSYAVLAAALLPCFWLYQDIGARLAAANHPGHPYADWLAMYSSAEFDESTRRAIHWTQRAALAADSAELAAMRTAFFESSRQELEFFDQRAAQPVDAGKPEGSGVPQAVRAPELAAAPGGAE